MKQRNIIGVLAVAGLVACDMQESQAPSDSVQAETVVPAESSQIEAAVVAESSQVETIVASDSSQVEAVVHRYFDLLAQYDYLAMRALATPEYETLDGGVRLTHPEFEDYVRGTAQLGGAQMAFDLSQFNTQIVSDIAYTTFVNTITDESTARFTPNLDGMILKRSGDQWLIDRFFHMRVAGAPPQVIRQYYHYIKAYNYDGMRALTTPGFEVTYDGLQLDQAGFEARHREEEQQLGPASSRPDRFDYQLVDFMIEVTDDVAHVTCVETHPGRDINYFNEFTLIRSGDRWLIDRLSHILVGEADTEG